MKRAAEYLAIAAFAALAAPLVVSATEVRRPAAMAEATQVVEQKAPEAAAVPACARRVRVVYGYVGQPEGRTCAEPVKS